MERFVRTSETAWKNYFEAERERLRDRYSGWAPYQRSAGARRDYRNGYYERDFVTPFGTIQLRIARTREKNFLRRAPELTLLIRKAFLRGISTRQVGRVVATLSGEVVSAEFRFAADPRPGFRWYGSFIGRS